MRLRFTFLFLILLLAGFPSWPREFHFSFWSDDPRPILDAIRKSAGPAIPPLPQRRRVCGGIVTHHFLASSLMVRFFSEMAKHSSPSTIILLGPNHYHHGLANISLSSLPWKTPFGIVPSDRQLVQSLAAAARLPEDPEAFTGEHSVSVLIPFIKYYFPHSRVVPILIDVNARPYDDSQYGFLSRLRRSHCRSQRSPSAASYFFNGPGWYRASPRGLPQGPLALAGISEAGWLWRRALL